MGLIILPWLAIYFILFAYLFQPIGAQVGPGVGVKYTFKFQSARQPWTSMEEEKKIGSFSISSETEATTLGLFL